jgi:U3 small nucleolar RNA-associated protein MPP10
VALAAVGKYLAPILGQSSGTQTRAKGGKKRKRNGANASNALWGPTPLDSITVEHLNEDQIWNQIELKNEKMSNLLKVAMVEEEKAEEDEAMRLMEEEEQDEQAMDEVEKKKQKKKKQSVLQDDDDEDDLGAMPKERIVHSLKDLSDADLRSLGLDPSHRAEFEDFDEMEDDVSESEEEDTTLGYPGASDLSDDDEMRGKVVTEPLRTEEQQRKRQAQIAAEERQRMREQRKMRKALGMDDDDEDEDDEDEEDDEEEEEDDTEDTDYAEMGGISDASEETASDSDDDSEEEQNKAKSERKRLSGILDNLDTRESNEAASKKWKSHPTLDDDFFSIEQFNRDTDDYGDEGISLGDDVDLFRPIADEDEPIHYSDFFAPPPGGTSIKQNATQNEEANNTIPIRNQTSERKTSVRFHEEVSVRRIKPRKSGEMEITPELLNAMQNGQGRGEEGTDLSEEEEDDHDDDDDDDDDDDQADAEEVEEEEDVELDTVGSDEEAENMDVDSSEEERGENAVEEQASMDEEETETVQRVAGDLFAEDAEEEEGKGAGKQQSTHQKRLEKLQHEIARLERENVSKKDWTLMGETGSRARPENSLLAEPLDFENNQKAKPVITQDSTATLEDLIKKRILESNFDDVERRANVQAFDFLPSKMLELSDTKSSKSLDQVYEDELGVGNGISHGEKMDKQLEQDHQEISRLYDELEYKLDALSNAHFTPKAPKATIQTISNTPTITMEESLPSTSNYASQLAPEEVYDVGRHNAALQGDRSEMTPEEKKRLQKQLRGDKKARNQRIDSVKKNVEINKQAFAKNRGGRFVGSGKKGSRNDAIEKQDALNKLLGNKGVSVVGKANEDKKRRQDTTTLNASHFKL